MTIKNRDPKTGQIVSNVDADQQAEIEQLKKSYADLAKRLTACEENQRLDFEAVKAVQQSDEMNKQHIRTLQDSVADMKTEADKLAEEKATQAEREVNQVPLVVRVAELEQSSGWFRFWFAAWFVILVVRLGVFFLA